MPVETYVNWSLADVALVPPGVVMVTSTEPAPAGEVAVIDVELLTVTPVAAVPPNLTVALEAKPVPVIETVVPPAAGPDEGETPVTDGTYENRSAALVWLVLVGVVTATSTTPAPAGAVALIEVSLLTLNWVAWVEPKLLRSRS